MVNGKTWSVMKSLIVGQFSEFWDFKDSKFEKFKDSETVAF